jgi:hypothetical protein
MEAGDTTKRNLKKQKRKENQAAALPPPIRFCALSRSFTLNFDKSGAPVKKRIVPTLFLDHGARFETLVITANFLGRQRWLASRSGCRDTTNKARRAPPQ